MLSARYRTREEVYPTCRSRLGTRTWETIVAACDDTLTPEAFPDTLALKVDAFGLPEFLPDLARLEWAQKVATSGGNTIPPEVDQLTLNPTLHLARCSWKNLLSLINNIPTENVARSGQSRRTRAHLAGSSNRKGKNEGCIK